MHFFLDHTYNFSPCECLSKTRGIFNAMKLNTSDNLKIFVIDACCPRMSKNPYKGHRVYLYVAMPVS